MKRFVLMAVAVATVVTSTHLRAAISEQVKIDSGLIAGTISGQPTVRVYKGIPFAAPPLANNRWKAPQPVAKWDGVRKADAFGAPCTSRGLHQIVAAHQAERPGPHQAHPPHRPRPHESLRAARIVCTSTFGRAPTTPTIAGR